MPDPNRDPRKRLQEVEVVRRRRDGTTERSRTTRLVGPNEAPPVDPPPRSTDAPDT